MASAAVTPVPPPEPHMVTIKQAPLGDAEISTLLAYYVYFPDRTDLFAKLGVTPVRNNSGQTLFAKRSADMMVFEHATNRQVAFIALQGTNSIDDVLNDMKIAPWTDANGQVFHTGFYQYATFAYKAITDKADHHILAALTGSGGVKTIYISGHSLGGAAAVILHYLLRNDPAFASIAIKVVTFGAPAAMGPTKEPWMLPPDSHVEYAHATDPVVNDTTFTGMKHLVDATIVPLVHAFHGSLIDVWDETFWPHYKINYLFDILAFWKTRNLQFWPPVASRL